MNPAVSFGKNCVFEIESSMPPQPAVKFSEHVSTTRKLMLIHGRTCVNSDESLPRTRRVRQKVVQIILTDADATDSSSDDDGEMDVQRVKRHLTEINVELLTKLRPKASEKLVCQKRFRGVRQRRWSSEIRDPTRRKRLWLGTHDTDTPEEAASVYDEASATLKVSDTVTNFPTFTKPETECNDVSSPTSVLRYGDLAAFDSFVYCAVDAFGFDIDMPLTLPDIELHRRSFVDEELGEFHLDDFSLELK
ncbi:hypothetical protein HHK36_018742 [Tetracentron sinense]|uniref:AP2/ERF domain-containing protein n=1 Tax=Tetracentron sinense TaxID=13715 RepID=A0A834YZY5_TETSI|nr:hypothetical protein HHK36_018742 [Tetracentron sinense]